MDASHVNEAMKVYTTIYVQVHNHNSALNDFKCY